MSDVDAWIYFDGPEPDHVRTFLDALREPLPVAPEEDERALRVLLEKLDAKLSSMDETPCAEDAPPPAAPESTPPPAVRRPPVDASGPVLLDDAEVESAPPTPGAPALQKAEEPPAPPPRTRRPPAFLAETARSVAPAASILAAPAAAGVRPAPEVRVAGAAEHPRTAQLPVMDPSQGARRPAPEMTLQDYVAYCVELELWPERRADVHRRRGVEGEEAFQEVARVWEGRIAASPQGRTTADAIRAGCLEHARTMQWTRSGA